MVICDTKTGITDDGWVSLQEEKFKSSQKPHIQPLQAPKKGPPLSSIPAKPSQRCIDTPAPSPESVMGPEAGMCSFAYPRVVLSPTHCVDFKPETKDFGEGTIMT